MLYKKNQTPALSAELFQNPTAEYRGAPFWAWNCELEKGELLWQLEVSRDGVLLHDPRGTAVAPGESDAAGLTEGECLWQVSCTDGRFSFHALAGDTAVTLARVSDIGFCICDDRILQDAYDAGFTLLRLTEESGEGDA